MVDVHPSHSRLRLLFTHHLAQAQHRNAYYLMLNGATGAATGLVFWILLTRFARLPPAEVGIGYAVVALGTAVGLLAKGGLDTALLRHVPDAHRPSATRLLRWAILAGVAVALALTLALAAADASLHLFPGLAGPGWILIAAIGTLLLITWLQDAYFLAGGDARWSFHRNLVFSGARLFLPLPVVALAWTQPVALAWAIALALSAVAAVLFARRLPHSPGRWVRRRELFRSAARNLTGSAAEFLPGLVLVPLVLAVQGPDDAAYFGIAWTIAALLFLASAAISRSALADMIRHGPTRHGESLRRGIHQSFLVVAPGAVAIAALAPLLLAVFGPAYAQNAWPALVLLAASSLAVAPAYLYLAVLRAHERPLALIGFPIAMITLLFVLVPPLQANLGITGVALAWLLANLPFGLLAAWRLRSEAREVNAPAPAPPLRRPAHVE